MMAFSILKVTGHTLDGVRYVAHVPKYGFCLVKSDEPHLKRLVLKFNDAVKYDNASLERHKAEYVSKGFTVDAIPLPSEF